MGIISDSINKIANKKKAFQELEMQDANLNKLQQRKMSSEERELLKFREMARQESIKQELGYYRNQQDAKIWVGATLQQKEDISKHENAFARDNVFKKMGKVNLR